MNVGEQYVLNELWLNKLKKNVASYYKTIYFGPPTFLLLNVMFCFSFQDGFGTKFWIMFVIVSLISTAYCVLLPLRVIKKYKNMVQSFVLGSDGKFQLTLIDNRMISISEYDIIDGIFNIDKTEKLSKSLTNQSDKFNYIIIPEFFTNVPVFA